MTVQSHSAENMLKVQSTIRCRREGKALQALPGWVTIFQDGVTNFP